MNPDIKHLWTAALRSGEYKQGKWQLKDDDQFCCLGVLCDIHHKSHQTSWRWTDGGSYVDSEGWSCVSLPVVVMQWADTNSSNPTVAVDSYINPVALSTLNDSDKTFAQIADLIDKSL